jgi:hypothetical protein
MTLYAPQYGACLAGCCSGPGHDEDQSFAVWEYDGEEYYRYPPHLIGPGVAGWHKWRQHYDAGYLPVAGGLLDQTARFVEAMGIIDSERARARENE